MKITYYGHATFLVEVNNTKLLFDPFISPNPLAKSIDIETIEADYILVTHGHEDHVADVAQIAKHTGATLISNFEIVTWFAKQGVEKGHPMNHGGQWHFDWGTVKYVTAIHSSTLPDGSGGGNPGGFVISTPEKTFYYSGDTALTYDMKLIGEQYELDTAFLCIGDNFTMGIDDAVIAADFIQCKDIIGMHFDTFGFIEINHAIAKQAFEIADKQLVLPQIGETFSK